MPNGNVKKGEVVRCVIVRVKKEVPSRRRLLRSCFRSERRRAHQQRQLPAAPVSSGPSLASCATEVQKIVSLAPETL